MVFSWTKEEDAAVMAQLDAVNDRLPEGKLGPVARLMPTTAATTLRKGRSRRWCIDGPFAETKEQLLGFYVVDCADLEEALDIARELGRGQPGRRLRDPPAALFLPGSRQACDVTDLGLDRCAR